MRSVEEVRALCAKHLEGQVARFLASEVRDEVEEFTLPLKPPTFAEVEADFPLVARWVEQWREAQSGDWEVLFETRRWPGLGEQQVPVRVIVRGGAAMAAVSGRSDLWCRVLSVYEAAAASFAELRHSVVPDGDHVDGGGGILPLVAVAAWAARTDSLSEVGEWERALAVASWVVRHPDSGLRPRSLPVPGVHTKWLGTHRLAVQKVVGTWREMLALPGGSELGLYAGSEASFIVVWADERLRPAGMRSAKVALSVLREMSMDAPHVWVFENLESVLSVPDLPGVVVIHGGGKAVSVLAQVPWIAGRRVTYWGDLDTHGFEILSRLRRAGVDAKSVLMDVETLMEHRDLWVEEKAVSAHVDRGALTDAECVALDALEADGSHWRLEQERIAWDWAMERLTLSEG